MKTIYSIVLTLLFITFLSACSPVKTEKAEAALSVYAAAGTAPAMKEIAAEFEKRTGTKIIFNFANAGVLAKQIENGGEAHIFFSANNKWMDYVQEKGLITPETRKVLLENEMVIIVPKGKAIAVDFTQPAAEQRFNGKFAIGDQSTPLGIYAKQAFTKLGWWEPLQNHLCVGETVNKALNYVALDEADAGIVFRSVASCAADKVDIVASIPAELHKPIRFPIAACKTTHPQANAFLEFTESTYAQNIFKKYGWNLCKQQP